MHVVMERRVGASFKLPSSLFYELVLYYKSYYSMHSMDTGYVASTHTRWESSTS